MLTVVRKWAGDVVFGIRLAAGGATSLWGRLALTAIGIGVGVAVLLLASSLYTMSEQRDDRVSARSASGSWLGQTSSGNQPTMLAVEGHTEFRDIPISSMILDQQRDGAPIPPGLSRIPGPGEAVVSPALMRVLDGPGGDLLRPRIGDRIVGTVGEEALASPGELFYYVGSDDLAESKTYARLVYQEYGSAQERHPGSGTDLRLIVMLGVTALLVPVVVFVAMTARLVEATRQRRLAALRLVGASGRQVRRIASGEALLGSLLGLAVGWGLFLAGRAVAERISVLAFSVYSSDIWPTWWCALLVMLGIPIIGVGTSISSMQRTIIEPLGVVRQTGSRSRRIAWRCAPIILGVLVLLGLNTYSGTGREVVFVLAVVLILVGVPLVLPWVVERLVHRLRGGTLGWQIAVRRLQMSSGTAARSVSVIAVVLTGVIALQTVLATSTRDVGPPGDATSDTVWVYGDLVRDQTLSGAAEALGSIPGVRNLSVSESVALESGQRREAAEVLDCPTLAAVIPVRQCRNGDAFYVQDQDTPGGSPIRGGEVWSLAEPDRSVDPQARVRLPPQVRTVPLGASRSTDKRIESLRNSLVLTPALAAEIPAAARDQSVRLALESAPPEAIEIVRNVAAQNFVGYSVSPISSSSDATGRDALRAIGSGLLLGSLVTFALIGCGLFVTAAEQIQERRRPMAVLGAVGTRRADLGWSALLQNGLPMMAAIVVSVILGLLLGGLVVLVMGAGMPVIDWVGLTGLVGIAIVSVLVVTALTLPVLGRSMRPEGLRTE